MTRAAWCLLACLACGCAKFRQAKECGVFVKTVNSWLAQGPAAHATDAAAEPTALASESRATALRYDELASKLAALHVESDELLPRVTRYQQIARDAAHALRDTADALDQQDLEAARKKRVDFDAVAQREQPLVAEINEICR